MSLHPHHTLVNAYQHEWGNSERVYPALIEYNTAYLITVAESGHIPRDAAAKLIAVLQALGGEGFGAIDYRPERDGLQPNLEFEVQRRVGADISGWLSIGRARQECELVARQIVEKDALHEVLDLTRDMAEVLLTLARRHVDAAQPYHTWAQHAEPITFGYYLAATARTVFDDYARMTHAFTLLDRSRAGIGQIVPPPMSVDRERLAVLLGFDAVLPNSLHAYGSIDIELGVLCALAIFTANLARLAETLFVWASTDFGFLRFGDAFTGTSYAMPHKRNPYLLRLARPAASRTAGAFTEATQLYAGSLEIVGNGLIHVPNRVIDSLDMVRDLCSVLRSGLPTIEVDRERMRHSARTGMVNAPQLLYFLIEHHDVPYRQAHDICGAIVTHAMAEGCDLLDLSPETIAVVLDENGRSGFDIDFQALRDALEPEAIIATRAGGGPAHDSVQGEIEAMTARLADIDAELERITARRRDGRAKLSTAIQSLLGQNRG